MKQEVTLTHNSLLLHFQVPPTSARCRSTSTKSWKPTSGWAWRWAPTRARTTTSWPCPKTRSLARASCSASSTWAARSCWYSRLRPGSSEFRVFNLLWDENLIVYSFSFNLQPGQVVRMGQRLGCVGEQRDDDDLDKTKKLLEAIWGSVSFDQYYSYEIVSLNLANERWECEIT